MIEEVNNNKRAILPITEQLEEAHEKLPDNQEAKVRNETGPWKLWSLPMVATPEQAPVNLDKLNCGIGYWQWTDLHKLIAKGSVQEALQLIERSPELIHMPAKWLPNQWYREGNVLWYNYSHFIRERAGPLLGPTPLALAVQVGSVDLTRKLLEKGAEANARFVEVVTPQAKSIEVCSKSPLALALEAQDLPLISLLLNFGADTDHVKLSVKVTEIVSCPYGAWGPCDASYPTEYVNHSFLQLAANNDDSIRLYIQHRSGKSNISQQVIDTYKAYENNTHQYPALHKALLENNVNAFLLLLDYGDDANSSRPVHPFDLALEHSNPLFVQTLIHHMDAKYVPEKLALAAQKGSFLAVEGLLSKGVVLTQEQSKRLYQAAFSLQDEAIARFLLNRGMTHPELILLAVDSSKRAMLDLVLEYKMPSASEIEEALQRALQKSPQDLEILARLFELRKK